MERDRNRDDSVLCRWRKIKQERKNDRCDLPVALKLLS